MILWYALGYVEIIIFSYLVSFRFVFYPNFAEDKDSACSALESKVFRVVNEDNEVEVSPLLSNLIPTLSDGYIARTMIQERYPDLPPSIGCIVYYYEILLDPKMVEKIKDSLKDK